MKWKRESAVAGSFYPAHAPMIEHMIEGFSVDAGAGDQERRQVPAIMVPHAGYIYSGRIAAYAYSRIDIPQSAIILCPNHTGLGTPISVWPEGTWETPLGEAAVDKALAQSFLESMESASPDTEAHLHEHAIEVQVPFLQLLNPEIRILPIVLGPLTLTETLEVGQALAKVIQGSAAEKLLLVASTDMCHFLDAETSKTKDDLALKEVQALNPKGLYGVVRQEKISMCGFIPTTAVWEAANQLGAKSAEILAYGHSGEVNKDLGSVVGYAAAWAY